MAIRILTPKYKVESDLKAIFEYPLLDCLTEFQKLWKDKDSMYFDMYQNFLSHVGVLDIDKCIQDGLLKPYVSERTGRIVPV